MHQNGVTLHPPNRMLDKETDVTEGCRRSLWLITSLGRWMLVTLARLLVRDCNLIPTVIRLQPQRTSSDPNRQSCKPIQIGRAFLLQQAVSMSRPAQGAPKKEEALLRESHDGMLQRLSCFLPLECARCLAASGARREARAVASIITCAIPCTAACIAAGVSNSRCGIRPQCSKVS